MRALIVDDENKARRVLKVLLEEINVDVVGECSDLLSAVSEIKKQQPDVVFLDIEMPKYSGLEILNFFIGEEVDFHIIFTTAYQKYAVEAFSVNAIDYLLKPINEDKLLTAVNKVQKLIDTNTINARLSNLESMYNQMSLNKIALEVPKSVLFVTLDDIIMLEADGSYTKVYLKNGKTELITKNLKYFYEQLHNKVIFYKPHRSYIINIRYIAKLEKKENFFIVLENKKTIPIARDKKEEFVALIEKLL